MDESIQVGGLVAVLLLSIVLKLVVSIIYRQRGREPEDPAYLAFRIMWRVLFSVGLFGTLILLAGMTGILLWIAILIVLAEIATRKREIARQSMLQLLAIASERSMPLEPLVDAMAHEQTISQRARSRQFAEQLHLGVPVAQAAEVSGGALPWQGVVAAYTGQAIGDLGGALREASRTYLVQQPLWRSVRGKVAYMVLVLLVGLSMLTFMSIKISPQFAKIFEDFGTELPLISQLIITASEALIEGPFAIVLVLLVVLLIHTVLRYIGWAPWLNPLETRWLFRFHTAMVLQSLALAARAEQSLLVPLRILAIHYPRRLVRRRLHKALDDIEAGRDGWSSLENRRLIRNTDAVVLQSAQRAGNLAWALQEMANSNVRRLMYRLEALTRILFPLLIILLGAFVALFVIGFFLPLVRLIEALT